MAHYEIKIKVAYDKAHPIPTEEQLKRNVDSAVGSWNLLNTDESVVEEWDCEIGDKGDKGD